MNRFLSAIVTTTLLIGLTACAAQSPSTPKPATHADVSKVDTQLKNDRFYRVLKLHYPSEAEFYRSKLSEVLATAKSQSEADDIMFKVGATIRNRHSAALGYASDLDLIRVIQTRIDQLENFGDDVRSCNKFAISGTLPDLQKIPTPTETIFDHAVLLFEVMKRAETNPVRRAPTTDADYAALNAHFLSTTAQEGDLERVVALDIDDLEYCGALTRYIEAINYSELAGADRVRANFAVAINSP